MIVLKLSLIKIETSGFRHFKACGTLIQGISKSTFWPTPPPFKSLWIRPWFGPIVPRKSVLHGLNKAYDPLSNQIRFYGHWLGKNKPTVTRYYIAAHPDPKHEMGWTEYILLISSQVTHANSVLYVWTCLQWY